MSRVRIDVRDLNGSGATGVFGAGLSAPASLTAPAHAPLAASGAAVRRSWWARGLRIVRDAAIAVAIMALVPVGYVAVRGGALARMVLSQNMDVAQRAAIAEPVRAFRLPTDPSITPLQAGVALNALQPTMKKMRGFETIEPETRSVAPWRTITLSSDMFASAPPDFYAGPSSQQVLEAAVKGFSPREMEYLKTIATAPIWREFDLVARAPEVDAIGARFRTPFDAAALPEARPLPAFRESRDLAQAAVARAAYYMAIGQPETAETVLRSIISYGFALIDNGTSGIEEIIGMVIVGTGRDALQRFYVIRHDPRSTLPALVKPDRDALWAAAARTSTDDARRQLLARIEDPATLRGERFEGLRRLSYTSCTNVRELLLGPDADARRVLADAPRLLARYPSERALIELQSRPLATMPNSEWTNPIQALVVSSATVAGAVLQNPRMASCTRILGGP